MMSMDATFDGLSYDTINYYPRSGGSRSIRATLEFLGPDSIGTLIGSRRPVIDIFVKNNSSSGISSAEVDTGGDKVELPLRYGLSVRKVRIVKIMGQEKALLHLRCQ
ncbi:MAG: hypothetical protein PVH61_44470 [Candidatus Aminicenantes bacterium]